MTTLSRLKQAVRERLDPETRTALSFRLHRVRARIDGLLGRRGRHSAQRDASRASMRPGEDPTTVNGVRVEPRRVEADAGAAIGRFAPPRVPIRKRRLARQCLSFLPRMHTPEHPTRWEIPALLASGPEPWQRELRGLYESPLAFPASLSPEAGLLVHALVRNIRPKAVVETGSFIGVSTIWIAAALKENGDGGVIHAFDTFGPIKTAPWRDMGLDRDRVDLVTGHIGRAGLAERVVLHPGDSPSELRAWARDLLDSGGVEMAFLDGDHGVRGVWHDLWAVEPAIRTGGFVLLHDTFPEHCSYDGPRHLLDHVNRYAVGRYEKLDLYLSPINYGLGVLRRVG